MKKPKLKYYNGLKNRFKNDWLIIVDTISILAVCLGLICFLMLFIYPWFTGKYLTPDTFFGGVAIKVIGGMAILLIVEIFISIVGEEWAKIKEAKINESANRCEKIKTYIKGIFSILLLLHTILIYLVIAAVISLFLIATWSPTINKILSLDIDISTIQLLKNIIPEIIPTMTALGIFGFFTFHFTAYYSVLNENSDTKKLSAKFQHWLSRIRRLLCQFRK